MSAKIVISGRYVSYECETIDEAFAKKIIENGITDDELDELSFADGGETGIVEAQVQINDDVIETFSIDDLNGAVEHNSGADWVLMKEEAGRIVYEPLDIDEDFSRQSLVFHKYLDSFNGYKIAYATPEYDGQDFEIDWSSAKVSDLVVIDPQGSRFSIDQIENEDESDEDESDDAEGVDPSMPAGVLLKNQAFAVSAEGDTTRAIAMMREAQSIHLNEFEPIELESIKITTSLASMLSDEGETDEAHQILMDLLKKIEQARGTYSTDYAKVCGWVARNLNRAKKWAESLAFSERYLLYFHEPDRWYELGLALESLGRKLEAEDVYQVALSYNDDEENPSAAMHLLRALFRVTKGSEARQDDVRNYLEGAIHFAELLQDKKMLEKLTLEMAELGPKEQSITSQAVQASSNKAEQMSSENTPEIEGEVGEVIISFDPQTLFKSEGKSSDLIEKITVFGHAHRLRLMPITEEVFEKICNGGWTVNDPDERESAELWFTDHETPILEGMFDNIWINYGGRDVKFNLPETLPVTKIVSGQSYLCYFEAFKLQLQADGRWASGKDKFQIRATNYDFSDTEYRFVGCYKNEEPFSQLDSESVSEGFFVVNEDGQVIDCESECKSASEITFSA